MYFNLQTYFVKNSQFCYIPFVEQRLADAVVHVGSDSNTINNPECGRITSDMIDRSNVLEITCNRKGRYLSVHLTDRDYLQLCEVKVYPGKCDEGKMLWL